MSDLNPDFLDLPGVTPVDEVLSVTAGLVNDRPAVVLTVRAGGSLEPQMVSATPPQVRRLVNDFNHLLNTSAVLRGAETQPGYDPGPLLPPYWLAHGRDEPLAPTPAGERKPRRKK